jgi:F-type H+-transporting ATPase subunit b
MLNRRLGRVPTVRFGVDASLIAGVELRGAHATLRNNWRADLDLIAQELSHDDDERAMA